MTRLISTLFAFTLSCIGMWATTASSNENTEVQGLVMLNHWDNLDGTIERGYAGKSIFWNHGGVDVELIKDYGKRNQEYGITATVLNNVNASPKILNKEYLDTVKVYADILRAYNIKVYLSVNFASPMVLNKGKLKTADPLNPQVQKWWAKKVKEIYRLIPDFGGFLVKANSEGQPGPCDYGRSHAEGANMLAKALQPYKGLVIWRAFVYSSNDQDRAKQAYNEFVGLDGQFMDNVIIQIKNGPIDFQPREPISPLFYALPKTKVMAELQITQEYLGHSNHLVYLAPMWEEFRDLLSSTTAKVNLVGYAGVSNIGLGTAKDHKPFTGNVIADENWRAFGAIANGKEAKLPKDLAFLSNSREACVNYMMPLGLHHLFAWGHHYGPQPWCYVKGGREDWFPSYYHKADAKGIGFDRTVATGSGATAQYPQPYSAEYEDLDSCPEDYILWFHHVAWDYTRKWCNGKTETLWDHLCHHYQMGVDAAMVQVMKAEKAGRTDLLPNLKTQEADAAWWRDACLLYFQTFSKLPIPDDVDKPTKTLEFYKAIDLGISNYECPSHELLNTKRAVSH